MKTKYYVWDKWFYKLEIDTDKLFYFINERWVLTSRFRNEDIRMFLHEFKEIPAEEIVLITGVL